MVEVDATAEKRLAVVAEHLAASRWVAAISLLRDVAAARPDALIRLSGDRSVSLPRYCDIVLSRLPAEGLAAYRTEIDSRAAAWLAEADATGDDRPLLRIVERLPLSSAGAAALRRLAERAWEAGDIATARRYWTRLVPLNDLPELPADAPALPTVLRSPPAIGAAAQAELAATRARLILCSLAEGQRHRAGLELAAFRTLHPDARDRLAGREGVLADLVAGVLPEAPSPSPGTADWLTVSATTATATLAETASRRGSLRTPPPARSLLWSRPLPPTRFVPATGRPALTEPPPLSRYPVIWRDKVFVADDSRVYGFEMADGRAAWAVGEGDPGVLFALPGGTDALPPPAESLRGTPHHSLTVQGDRLFARLGPPASAWPARDLRRPDTTLVCLDLNREGGLVWLRSAGELGPVDEEWAFEGPPAAVGDRLFVLANRSRPQPRLDLICLSAASGETLWSRPLGSPLSAPPDGQIVLTHRLVTEAGGRLYVATDWGAVLCLDAADGRPVWASWYDSVPPPPGPAANDPGVAAPAVCLVAGGVVVVAPNDSDRLFACDAESGLRLWEHPVRGGGRTLVGERDGVLVVSGRRLHGLDLFSGRSRWTIGTEDPPGFGAGCGLIAGPTVFWPTRESLLAIDAVTGRLEARLPLKPLHGLTGGGHLASDGNVLLLSGAERLTAFGEKP